MRAASIAAAVAVAGVVLLVVFRAFAWLVDAAVTAGYRLMAQDDDSHDVWPTDMESAK